MRTASLRSIGSLGFAGGLRVANALALRASVPSWTVARWQVVSEAKEKGAVGR